MRLFASLLALAMVVAVTVAIDCSANSNCRGGTCINGKCAPFSGTGGPCNDAGDCLYGNTCDLETQKCKVPCPGQVNCGTVQTPNCKTVSSDNQNCGACGNVCPNGKACVGGQCLCSSGSLNCGNTCVDPNTNVYNCGSCGNKCGQNAFCSGGLCSCNINYGNCLNDYNFDGCESNLYNDDTFCGACGTGRNCAGSGNTDSYCSSGSCRCQNNGYANCDGVYSTNGCEINLSTDDTYCGACGSGRNCGGSGNANSYCSSGSCRCQDNGYANCDGVYSTNGCEINLNIDDTYCGGCGSGKNCGGSGNTDSTCSNGQCGCSSPTAYANCYNGFAADGCETDIRISDGNCGSCGNYCGGSGNTDSYCFNSQCGCSNSNYANCYNGFGDGCETNVLISDGNCGSCGNLCGGSGNTDSACSGGSCVCYDPNYRNCVNGYASDGCETDIRTSDGNCGSCGNVCGGSGSTDSVCSAGSCTCSDSKYKNCFNGYASDGCETNTYTDSNNCGSCGVSCGTNAYCDFSFCFCDDYYGDCDDDLSTGCETYLANDPLNCGSCDQLCTGAGYSCANNICTYTAPIS